MSNYIDKIGFLNEQIVSDHEWFFKDLKQAITNTKDFKIFFVNRDTYCHYYDLVVIVNYKKKCYKALPVPILGEALGEKNAQQREYLMSDSLQNKFKWLRADDFEELKQEFNKDLNLEFVRLHEKEFDEIPDSFYTTLWKKEVEEQKQDWATAYRYSYKFDEQSNEYEAIVEECNITADKEYGGYNYSFGNWKIITMKKFLDEYKYSLENDRLFDGIIF